MNAGALDDGPRRLATKLIDVLCLAAPFLFHQCSSVLPVVHATNESFSPIAIYWDFQSNEAIATDT
jgi:hypothetical protein